MTQIERSDGSGANPSVRFGGGNRRAEQFARSTMSTYPRTSAPAAVAGNQQGPSQHIAMRRFFRRFRPERNFLPPLHYFGATAIGIVAAGLWIATVLVAYTNRSDKSDIIPAEPFGDLLSATTYAFLLRYRWPITFICTLVLLLTVVSLYLRSGRRLRSAPYAEEIAHAHREAVDELRLAAHPYITRRVAAETAAEFRLGYCDHGLFKGRICIPIHNERGELVAYAGRWPGEDAPEGQDKYLLQPNFQGRHVLFNLHRVKGSEHLTIVEGFFSVFRLHEIGVPAVALLGRYLSGTHELLLKQSGAKYLTLMLDGTAAARKAAMEIVPRLARDHYVHLAELPDGAQPDTIGREALRDLVRLPWGDAD